MGFLHFKDLVCCPKVMVAIHCDSFCEKNIKAKAIDEEGSKTVDSRVFMIGL